MSLPKTLLLTHYPPNRRNGSVQHVQPLLERYPDNLVWFSTKAPDKHTPWVAPSVPYQHGWVPSRGTVWPLRPLRQLWVLSLWARKLAREAAAFGREHEVEVVWAELSLETVEASRCLARALNVPLVASALDDPPTLVAEANYPLWIQSYFRQSLRKTLREASRVGVISQALADEYRDRYEIDASVLYCGVDDDSYLQSQVLDPARRPFVLGTVGSVISKSNWQLLVDAVVEINRQAGEERLKILQVGELASGLDRRHVEVTGWVRGRELEAQLRRFDLCFLSMFFRPSMQLSARTAFPTKTRDYVRAQRPIVAFGPPDSHVVRFVRDAECGTVCTRHDRDALVAAVDGLLDADVYGAATSGMQKLKTAFSRQHYFQAFERLIQSQSCQDDRHRRE